MALHILVTNDDGIHAPGLRALAKELGQIGIVTVVAPAHERSAAAQSLTLRQPIYCEQLAEREFAVDGTPADAMILDIGPQSIARVNAVIDDAATLVWNGPLGAFEMHPFDKGTVAAAKHAAARTRAHRLVSVAGGGDTVAALNQAGVADAFTYISTAGGAFLEWMEGKPLPGVEVLRTK